MGKCSVKIFLPVFGIFRLRDDTELLSAVRSTGIVIVLDLSPIDDDWAPAPWDELEWWVAEFPLLFPFRSTIGEDVATFACCKEEAFALEVLDGFGLVLPCSLKARSFLTACGLAAPIVVIRNKKRFINIWKNIEGQLYIEKCF